MKDFPKLLRTNYPNHTNCNQPGMHFTAKNGLERVFDAVKQNEALYSESADKFGTFSKFENKLPKGWDSGTNINSLNSTMRYKVNVVEAARKIRGDLHNKTHFQAVLSMLNRHSISHPPRNNKPYMLPFENEDFGTLNDLAIKNQEKKRSRKSNKGLLRETAAFKSLPKIEKANIIDNTSPLKDLKRKSLGHFNTILDQNISSEIINNKTTDNNDKNISSPPKSIIKGSMTNKNNNVSKKKVCFPIISPSCLNGFLTSSIESHEISGQEQLALKILKHCNVLRSKSPASGVLRKGEGKLMSGFGLTNRETYYKIFGSNGN